MVSQELIVTKLAKIAGIVAMLSLPDSAVKSLTGTGVNWYLDDQEEAYGQKLSTTLMRKCVNGDTSTFTREDLDAINPIYGQTLDKTIQLVFSNRLNPENDRDVESDRRWSLDQSENFEETYANALQRAEEAKTIMNNGAGVLNIDTWDEQAFLGDQKFNNNSLRLGLSDVESTDQSLNTLVSDFSRALGVFSIQCGPANEPCYVIDYFDFEVTPDITHSQRLTNAINLFSEGLYDAASQNLGQMFCQEGENEQPTETSIPIRIEVSRPTFDF